VDKATLGGLVLAIGGILLGLMLEGGNLGQVLQPTAALIVFGGTLGAILFSIPCRSRIVRLSAPGAGVSRARAECAIDHRSPGQIRQPGAARRHHLARQRTGHIRNPSSTAPSCWRSMELNPRNSASIMELELDNKEEQEEKIPQLFESAGGFSPTIGIIGAVLGLIQVMQHLDKIDEVGKGIAVAFVATLYGVGAANLILLPCAGKLKIRIRDEQIIREMTFEGVVSILEGMNPRMLEEKLLGFLTEVHRPAAGPGESRQQIPARGPRP
jgi:chemotaxis protein MotA